MKINREWHLVNKMPKNPTTDQRIKWHLEHARNCQCRPISGDVLDEIQKRLGKLERKDVWMDELYKMAKTLVIKHHKASAIFLQRKLMIDYERAMNLLEELQKNGVVRV